MVETTLVTISLGILFCYDWQLAMLAAAFAPLLQKLGISMNALGGFGGAVVMILWFGGHRVIAGAMTVGQLMFFFSMVGYLLAPLERLSVVNLQIQEASIALDRLYQILDLRPEPGGGPRQAKLRSLGEGIVLRNVSFRYGSPRTC